MRQGDEWQLLPEKMQMATPHATWKVLDLSSSLRVFLLDICISVCVTQTIVLFTWLVMKTPTNPLPSTLIKTAILLCFYIHICLCIFQQFFYNIWVTFTEYAPQPVFTDTTKPTWKFFFPSLKTPMIHPSCSISYHPCSSYKGHQRATHGQKHQAAVQV